MMTEPTLGQRIMDAAEAYANAVQEAIQTWGAGEWTSHHDEDTAMELDFLRTLCARADAAERLAKCCHELNNIDFDDYLEALAAWRAITEEVTDG